MSDCSVHRGGRRHHFITRLQESDDVDELPHRHLVCVIRHRRLIGGPNAGIAPDLMRRVDDGCDEVAVRPHLMNPSSQSERYLGVARRWGQIDTSHGMALVALLLHKRGPAPFRIPVFGQAKAGRGAFLSAPCENRQYHE
jgi:hypothetical protein